MLSWPATLMEFWSWHVEAACRAVDMSLFYSPEGERGPRKRRRERAAKEICARCQVAEVCGAFAIATREPHGTWGGLSEGDRRKLWRRTDQATAQLGYRRALADWERRKAEAGSQLTVTVPSADTATWSPVAMAPRAPSGRARIGQVRS